MGDVGHCGRCGKRIAWGAEVFYTRAGLAWHYQPGEEPPLPGRIVDDDGTCTIWLRRFN